MFIKDHFAEIILSLFDGLMNVFTLGAWTRSQGDVIVNVKVKE